MTHPLHDKSRLCNHEVYNRVVRAPIYTTIISLIYNLLNITSSLPPFESYTTNPTTMSDYKPTEHGGLRQDGQPDKRVGTGGNIISTHVRSDN